MFLNQVAHLGSDLAMWLITKCLQLRFQKEAMTESKIMLLRLSSSARD